MTKLLIINPGSTTTKIAIFDNGQSSLEEKILHPPEELDQYATIWEQLEYRYQTVLDFLDRKKYRPDDFTAIVARGGLLKPLKGGTYIIDDAMMKAAEAGPQGMHPANMACVMAYRIAARANLPAYVVDPISVDEFEPLARYSGHPAIERRCLSHALNLHATGRKAAAQLGIRYQKSRLILAHLGGGISVCALKCGKMIDVNDASSDGPFSPERTGGLPLQQFITLCYSGQYTMSEMHRLVMGKGGLLAYLNTFNAREVEDRIAAGDKKAHKVYEAMAYQVAKEIGAMSTVLMGDINAIVLCGALAHSALFTGWIKERVKFIAPLLLFPGEFEMQALADGVIRVLKGLEKALKYEISNSDISPI